MKMLTLLLLIMCILGLSPVFAEDAVPIASKVVNDTEFLTSGQMYNLLVYSIVGSLGVLGLLLGLDKVILMLFRRGDSGEKIQKYSSESVAQILPIVIEGITVILVVLTVIILGVSKTISAEGTLGILGSIVGYVLGKGSRKIDLKKGTDKA